MKMPGLLGLKAGPWDLYLPFLLYLLHASLFHAWLVDDAGISFVYARNLIQGYGLVTQPGSPPVEGFSNPLWVVLLSPLFLADLADPTFLVKLVSYVCTFATYFVVRRVVYAFLADAWWARAATLGTLLTLSMNTSFVVWTVSGLENPLYALLIALYGVFCIRSFNGAAPIKMPVLAGLTVAGLALTRPDGVFFLVCFPVLAVFAVRLKTCSVRGAIMALGCFIAGAALPMGAYLGFRVRYFGDFLPNTYRVKGGPTMLDIANLATLSQDSVDRTYDLLRAMFGFGAGWAAVILTLFGGFVLAKTTHKLKAITLIIFVFSTWAVYMLLPEDWMGEYRFATPFFVIWGAATFIFAAELAATRGQNMPRLSRAGYILFVGAVMVNSGIVFYPRSKEFASDPTVPFSRVALQAGLASDVYAQYLELPDATYLCPDVGGAYYYSPLRVYDLVGLCDAKIAKIRQGKNTTRMRDYIFDDLKPTFIVIHSVWATNLAIHGDSRLASDYAVIWETPFVYTIRGRQFRTTSGAYVRSDAITGQEKLDRLKRFIAENDIAPLEFHPATEAFQNAVSENPEGWNGEGTGRLSPFPYPNR